MNDYAANPLVSILCPTYNHEQFIAQAIDGFVMQKTNFPFEIIVHDDASADGTTEIVKSYEAKYPRLFRNIYQAENRYSKDSSSLNRIMFAHARGKYFALCEGDDYWTDPYKLQKQVDFLEGNPEYGGCYHDTLVIYDEEVFKPHLFRTKLKEIMTVEDTLSIISPFHTSSFVFRNLLADVHFKLFKNKNIVSGDMLLFSIVAGFGTLRKVEGLMSVYRIQSGGITQSKYVKNNYHRSRIFMIKLLNVYYNYKYNERAQEVIQYHNLQLKKNSIFNRSLNLLKNLKLHIRKNMPILFKVFALFLKRKDNK